LILFSHLPNKKSGGGGSSNREGERARGGESQSERVKWQIIRVSLSLSLPLQRPSRSESAAPPVGRPVGRSQNMYNRDHRTFSFPYYRAGEMSPNAERTRHFTASILYTRAHPGGRKDLSFLLRLLQLLQSVRQSDSILHTTVRSIDRAREPGPRRSIARGGEASRGRPGIVAASDGRQSPGRRAGGASADVIWHLHSITHPFA